MGNQPSTRTGMMVPHYQLNHTRCRMCCLPAVYKCKNKHTLLAHDEIILSHFPTPTLIPFVLLKRSGITSSLADMCTSLTVKGMNFRSMESLILDRRMTTFARVCDTIRHHELLTCKGSKVHTLPEFWSTELSNSPSNFILKQCNVLSL